MTEVTTASGGSTSLNRPDTAVGQTSERALDASNALSASNEPKPDSGPSLLDPLELAELVDPKDLNKLIELGGVDKILAGLDSDRIRGLSFSSTTSGHASLQAGLPASNTSLEDRQRIYGRNALPPRKQKSLIYFLRLATRDTLFKIFFATAIVAFALGLAWDIRARVYCFSIGDFGCQNQRGAWVEGVVIMVAIWALALVGALSDKTKERRIEDVKDISEIRSINVVRDGMECIIDVKDVVVGDIALLQPGDIIPCDGICLDSHNIVCDESLATGETDPVKKSTYDQAFEANNRTPSEPGLQKDCFIISGTRVIDGCGRYIVIAVGPQSTNGRFMMALQTHYEVEITPHQLMLNKLAEKLAMLGILFFSLLFISLMIRFFIALSTTSERPPFDKGMYFIDISLICLALLYVVVPEGMPLNARLALSFAMKRMVSENVLVRTLYSCEAMATTTMVCTGKTGILTQDAMTVVAGSIGVHAKFGQENAENQDEKVDKLQENLLPSDFAVERANLNDILEAPLKMVFNDALCINSTAFLNQNTTAGEQQFVGSETESAMLCFANDLGWENYKAVRDAAQVLHAIPFSSERKCSGVVIKANKAGARLYLKGAPEMLAAKCTRHVVVQRPGTSQSNSLNTKLIDHTSRTNVEETITHYATQSLRTMAICYRDFPSWSPLGHVGKSDINSDVSLGTLLEDLTLIAVLALQNPLRLDSRDAVEKCKRAGVTVKMCTGDHLLTARSIAAQCGIYTPEGIVMEGQTFRALSNQERIEVVPRLQVLARSTPEDKKALVQALKSLGESVCVTGGGAGDVDVLKVANVGLSKGISGVQAAKDSSGVILMNDSFASIPSAIMWGRTVNDAVRRLTQFQMPMNTTVGVVTFASAVASDRAKSALSSVQLLWISLVMDILAGFALARGSPSPDVLDQKPGPKVPPLLNTNMLKQIVFQSLYQIVVLLLFHFGGDRIFSFNYDGKTIAEIAAWKTELGTMVFNSFMFCQICNLVNCRRIDRKKNVFSGIWRDWLFVVVILLEIVAQVLIVLFGDTAFKVCRMSARYWEISIAIGLFTLPLGFLVRLLPNRPFTWLFVKLRLMEEPDVLPVTLP